MEVKKIFGISDKWYVFIVATLMAGVAIEVANTHLIDVWRYSWPWDLYIVPILGVSAITLTFGWLLLGVCSLVPALIYERFVKKGGPIFAWTVGWIVVGFVYEIFNSKVYRMWDYREGSIFSEAMINYLEFGLLVPFVGYVFCGLVSFSLAKFLQKYF